MAKKPSNATWVARAKVDANSAEFPLEVPDHRFREVEVAWYANPDRLKVTLVHGGPAMIKQVYLSGADANVIIDFVAA